MTYWWIYVILGWFKLETVALDPVKLSCAGGWRYIQAYLANEKCSCLKRLASGVYSVYNKEAEMKNAKPRDAPEALPPC